MALAGGEKLFDSPATQDVVGVIDEHYVARINREALRQLPAEKVSAQLRQFETARIMQKAGSLCIEGMGQKAGSIDARIWFRWHQQYPGCWNDPEFVKKMLRDNPELCAPGYYPHRKRVRSNQSSR